MLCYWCVLLKLKCFYTPFLWSSAWNWWNIQGSTHMRSTWDISSCGADVTIDVTTDVTTDVNGCDSWCEHESSERLNNKEQPPKHEFTTKNVKREQFHHYYVDHLKQVWSLPILLLHNGLFSCPNVTKHHGNVTKIQKGFPLFAPLPLLPFLPLHVILVGIPHTQDEFIISNMDINIDCCGIENARDERFVHCSPFVFFSALFPFFRAFSFFSLRETHPLHTQQMIGWKCIFIWMYWRVWRLFEWNCF